MNKSGIEWTDYSWNPVTGCLHGCQYCYARKMTARFSGDIRRNKTKTDKYSFDGATGLYHLFEPFRSDTGGILSYPFGFEPTFHEYRLNWPQEIKNGANIFVGAMADMFGSWVPDEVLNKVFNACVHAMQHNYLFLTKSPERYNNFIDYYSGEDRGSQECYDFFDKMWFGTTITCNEDLNRLESLDDFDEGHRFLSIEPLLEDIDLKLKKTRCPKCNSVGIYETNPFTSGGRPPYECDCCGEWEGYQSELKPYIEWIIIGAETGNRKNKVVPEWEWIKKIVLLADNEGIPVFMKDSLIPIVGEKNMRREFPKQLQQRTVSPKIEAKMNDICGRCRKPAAKKDMVAILARSKRGEGAKHITYLCKECLKTQCEEWGTEVPELEGLKGGN